MRSARIGKENRSTVVPNQLGTFGGVFTPSILTILGVIIFMRAGFVIGQTGIFQAFLILFLASSITALTSLSISAISTNTPVAGGGAYFLISRALGPSFGGSIGLALFCAQAIFGSNSLVVAGVFAATLSSAIGSFLGAPRVLQAVARDRLIPSNDHLPADQPEETSLSGHCGLHCRLPWESSFGEERTLKAAHLTFLPPL
jgi:amino acid transporter